MEKHFPNSRFRSPIWPPTIGAAALGVGAFLDWEVGFNATLRVSAWLVAIVAGIALTLLSIRDWKFAKKGGVTLAEEEITIYDGWSSKADKIRLDAILELRRGNWIPGATKRVEPICWFEVLSEAGRFQFLARESEPLIVELRAWVASNAKNPNSQSGTKPLYETVVGRGLWFTPPRSRIWSLVPAALLLIAGAVRSYYAPKYVELHLMLAPGFRGPIVFRRVASNLPANESVTKYLMIDKPGLVPVKIPDGRRVSVEQTHYPDGASQTELADDDPRVDKYVGLRFPESPRKDLYVLFVGTKAEEEASAKRGFGVVAP